MFEGEKYSAQTFTRYEELLATSNTETAKNKSANFAGYFARSLLWKWEDLNTRANGCKMTATPLLRNICL